MLLEEFEMYLLLSNQLIEVFVVVEKSVTRLFYLLMEKSLNE